MNDLVYQNFKGLISMKKYGKSNFEFPIHKKYSKF